MEILAPRHCGCGWGYSSNKREHILMGIQRMEIKEKNGRIRLCFLAN
jgi:hypothetical protein